MAKSEQVEAFKISDQEIANDVETILDASLDDVPEAQELRGPWEVQFVYGTVYKGMGAKGPWTRISVSFIPVTPVGDDAQEMAAELDMDDLPQLQHTIWYSTNEDMRRFKSFVKAFGVDPSGLSLRDALEDLRGQTAVTRLGKMKSKRTGNDEVTFGIFYQAPAAHSLAA